MIQQRQKSSNFNAKDSTAQHRSYDWWKPVVLLLIIATVFSTSFFFGIDTKFIMLRDWISSFGILSIFVFMLIYIGAVVVALPGTILGVLAGALFGSVVGVILVSISSTIGSGITFLIARYFARDAVVRWLSKYKTFQKLDDLTEKRGAIIVGITRLIPIFPFNLLNYAFGLTKVRFRTYLFWSWLCMLPGTILVVVGTDAVLQSIMEKHIPWLLIGVISMVLGILILLSWYLRKKSYL